MKPFASSLGDFQVLWEDGERIFGRVAGFKKHGRSTVLALLGAGEHPTPAIHNRFAHEYGLRNELDGAWAARPLELISESGRTMLLLEDPGGEPLERLLGQPMELGQFLRLAIHLSAALHELHERGIIHKDVKPANVLVDVAIEKVWLTGFGIASRLPRERPAPAPPEIIAGTLAYMAPEQTGRMNRSIDARSDLYALGVTLYQMLTGILPFAAADPIELIHCQVAREPVPPDELVGSVPATLSMIVMKLLAKTAEERYQTAAGLRSDLLRCLAGWDVIGRIEPFPLGTKDASDRLAIPERLYGRDAETASLLAAFDRVLTRGGSELVLVSGYSGIGKSSVVNELHKVIVLPRGIFISGKFDLRRTGTPYSTLADAFQGLIRQILSGRLQDIAPWREAICEAVGNHGALLTDLIPDLVQMIGPQPPVPELSSLDTQIRFRQLFKRFVGVFARAEHPLVVFIDDLQWLDPATVGLIEDLVTDLDTQHVLFIGAYRDNEVTAAHPLMLTLERIRKSGTTIEEIMLGPLSLDGVSRLLCDALRGEPATVRPLAELVHRKTGGNPFFAGQFLASLAEAGLLVFDRPSLCWTWDLAGIHRKGPTDNLVDLMIGRLRRLPLAALEALQTLSCLGSQADFTTLATIHGSAMAGALAGDSLLSKMHESFRAAIRAEVVLAQEGRYRFLHDRVQEAAYALIPSEARADFHLRIGRLLVRGLSAQDVFDKVFDIVNQLNRGFPLLSDWGEKKHVAELDLQAGRKAKASAAYAAACGYFAAGMAALSEEGWTRCHDLAVNLWLERAECELLSSNIEEAAKLVDGLLEKGRSTIDRAAAYRLRMILQLMRGDAAQAVGTALECLTMFGLQLPAKPTLDQVQVEYDDVRRRLGSRSIESLIDLPLMDDPEMQAAMKIMGTLITPAYFADGNLYQMLACRLVNLTLQRGTSEFSVIGYGGLAISLGPLFHRFEEGERFAKLGVDIAERYGFRTQKVVANYLMQMATLWTRPIEHAMTWLDAAMQYALDTGEIVFACYSLEGRLTDLIASGEPLDMVRREAGVVLDYARRNKFRHIDDVVSSVEPFIQSLRGPPPNGSPVDEAALEARLLESGVAVSRCYYWILQMRRHFVLGDFQKAIESAEKAQPTLWAARLNIRSVDYFFYHSLAIAAVFEACASERKADLRDNLVAHLASFQRWAKSCPATFAHKHALVSAEWARLEGREIEALQLYEQAIRSASEHGFVQDQALASELAARFCRSRGLDKAADFYLDQARDCYARWGAIAKVAQIDQSHPRIRQRTLSATKPTIEAPVEQFDLATVIRMSQAVVGEIVLKRLVETLMVIAAEHAGADRGLLVLTDGGQYRVEAEATSDRDGIKVRLLGEPVRPSELPVQILEQVLRTRDHVILDDARGRNAFAEDEYIGRKQAWSLLCLPLLKQAEPVGVLYLENSLASNVFTPARITVLKLLAAQAAISLENTRLYRDLAAREAEARENERRYHQAQMELEHANRVATMGQLTASIAHEVSQPIGATALNAQAALRWLNRATPDLEETRQLLGRIEKDSHRARNVVNRIRDLVKKAPSRMELLDISKAINEVIELAAGEAARNGVSVHMQLAEDLPAANADPTQLQQVILNLILNAVQAMHESEPGSRKLFINTSANGPDGLLVSIRDTGPGIPPEHFDRLFDPFYTTKSSGMGMGLAICRSIVEAHGGRIWATANVPRGAAFHFTLSATAASAEPA